MHTDRTADTEAITGLIRGTVTSWGVADAEAYGSHFTADATYVTWVGTLYAGRAEIVRAHAALFDRFLKDTRLVDDLVEIRFLGPDSAVATSRGDVYKGDKRPEPGKLTKVQTYTLVREPDGAWRIAAFQNTKRKSLMEKISFKFAPETAPAGR